MENTLGVFQNSYLSTPLARAMRASLSCENLGDPGGKSQEDLSICLGHQELFIHCHSSLYSASVSLSKLPFKCSCQVMALAAFAPGR